MKKIIFNYLFVIAIVSITLLSACADEGNAVDTTLIYPYKMTLTLDGDGFTNKTVTLQKTLSTYSSSYDETFGQFYDVVDGDSLYFYFQYIGGQTGTSIWRQTELDAYLETSYNDYYYPLSGETIITSYGDIRGSIEGTISGVLYHHSTNAQITISGTFNARRIGDYD
jgi:hypothetical protein